MIYAELSGYAIMAMGGFAAGAIFGRKLGLEAAGALHALESRLVAMEHRVVEPKMHSSSAAPAPDAHAAALTRLAGAIEKHAAAIDDHGAATVAAAVEGNAAASASVASK